MADYRQGTAVLGRDPQADRRLQGRGGLTRAQSYGIRGARARTRGEPTTSRTSSATSGATSSTRRSAAPFRYPRPVYVRRARDRTPRRAPHLGEHAAGPGRRSRSPRRAGQCAGRRRGGPVSASVTLPKGILSGVRILDFTWKTVGPWAPRLLTHFGAEVIHVERVGSSG